MLTSNLYYNKLADNDIVLDLPQNVMFCTQQSQNMRLSSVIDVHSRFLISLNFEKDHFVEKYVIIRVHILNAISTLRK